MTNGCRHSSLYCCMRIVAKCGTITTIFRRAAPFWLMLNGFKYVYHFVILQPRFQFPRPTQTLTIDSAALTESRDAFKIRYGCAKVKKYYVYIGLVLRSVSCGIIQPHCCEAMLHHERAHWNLKHGSSVFGFAMRYRSHRGYHISDHYNSA